MALKKLKSCYQKLIYDLESKIPRREGRIYIIPTSIGFYYSAGLFICFLLAVTYGNSLSYVTTFILMSFMLSVTFVTNYHLKDIFIRAKDKESILIPGWNDELSYVVSNRSNEEKVAINIDSKELESFLITRIGNKEIKEVSVKLKDYKRGVLTLNAIRFSTEFPFSLFKSWSFSEDEYKVFIAPRPMPTEEFTVGGHGNEDGEKEGVNQGIDDYQGLNKYDEGHQVSRIDWKSYSQKEELYIKKYHATSKSVQSIEVLNLEGSIEERLAKGCYLLLKSMEAETPILFTLGNKTIGPGLGKDFEKRCLKELALYE